jgi:hypothetical protein
MLSTLRATTIVLAMLAIGWLPASAWAQAGFFFCDPSVDRCEDLTGSPNGDPFADDFDNFDDFDDDFSNDDFDDDFDNDDFDDFADDFDDEFNGSSDFEFGNGDFDDFDNGGGFQVGDDFNGGFDGNPVRIQRFDLTGNGCPALGSTRVFLDGNGEQNRLRVQFGRNGGRFLQVQGQNDVRSCTTRARVLVNDPAFAGSNGGANGGFVVTAGGVSEFRLRRLVAGVRFVNPEARGELVVRSQSRVEGISGPVTRLRLPNSAQVRVSDVRANQNIRVRTDGDIQLLSIIELESRGSNGGIIRLEDLDIEFDVIPF